MAKRKPDTIFVEYDGIRFFPTREGYWLGNAPNPNGKRPRAVRMHIYVWEKHNGPVPEGFHIHHKDKNKDNNSIENLVLLSEAEHLSMHGLERSEQARKNVVKYAHPAATEWHKSEAGKEWHSNQFQRTLGTHLGKTVTKVCEMCGEEYETPYLKRGKSRFCSNKCKARFRKASGIDNITVNCVVCGKQFETDKYSRAKTCSPECRQASRIASRKR
jgi:hypothetical protein